MADRAAPSRPRTPHSPLTSSLRHATATIDDLTLALANYSRVPSPEPPTVLRCCCGREDCENTKALLAFKSDLESRLILSAGESYSASAALPLEPPHRNWTSASPKARSIRTETRGKHSSSRCCFDLTFSQGLRTPSNVEEPATPLDPKGLTQDEVDSQVDLLLREKSALEKVSGVPMALGHLTEPLTAA